MALVAKKLVGTRKLKPVVMMNLAETVRPAETAKFAGTMKPLVEKLAARH
jgi:hypothetical protein